MAKGRHQNLGHVGMMQVTLWQEGCCGKREASKPGTCSDDAGDVVARGRHLLGHVGMMQMMLWQIEASKPGTCWDDAGDVVARGRHQNLGHVGMMQVMLWQEGGIKTWDMLG